MSDEDDVRTLLRDSDIPTTGLDVAGLMADSRRSRRRRRAARVAGAVLAVVAVAVPAAVVSADRWTAPEPAAGDFATTTRVVHRTTHAGDAAECTRTPLPGAGGGAHGVQAVDETGERVVAVSYSVPILTMWTRREPGSIQLPGLRAPRATVTAVNSSGFFVGYDPEDPATSFIYRDGAVHALAKPDGYHQALVVDVNERGDALGVLSPPGSPDDRRALVIWPAGRPDQPRVVAEAGLTPVAIRDDGTVIALHTGERRLPTDRGDAVVVLRPDGTRLRIDAPPGFDRPGSLATGALHGDLLYTTRATGETVEYILETNERISRPLGQPVRWNLRTGSVEVYDDVFAESGAPVASSGGWLLATSYRAGVADTLVGPDGSAHRLPADTRADWVSADGSTLIGYYAGAAVTWWCPR